MLELIAVHGSAVVRWWYIEYGFAAPVYGHWAVPGVGVVANDGVIPLAANIPVEFMFTDDDDVLKQFTEF